MRVNEKSTLIRNGACNQRKSINTIVKHLVISDLKESGVSIIANELDCEMKHIDVC